MAKGLSRRREFFRVSLCNRHTLPLLYLILTCHPWQFTLRSFSCRRCADSSTIPWIVSAPPRPLGTTCTAYHPVRIGLNVFQWHGTNCNGSDNGRDGSPRLAVGNSVSNPCLPVAWSTTPPISLTVTELNLGRSSTVASAYSTLRYSSAPCVSSHLLLLRSRGDLFDEQLNRYRARARNHTASRASTCLPSGTDDDDRSLPVVTP